MWGYLPPVGAPKTQGGTTAVGSVPNIPRECMRLTDGTRASTVVSVAGPLQVLHEADECLEYWDLPAHAAAPNYLKCKRASTSQRRQSCVFPGTTVPSSMISGMQICPSLRGPCTVSGRGVAPSPVEADLTVLVTSVDGPSCTSGALAAADACQVDQHGRPTLGALNLCPAVLATASTPALDQLLLHELLHVVGFSDTLFPLFRNCSGHTQWPCPPRLSGPAYDARLFGQVPGLITLAPGPSRRRLVVSQRVSAHCRFSCFCGLLLEWREEASVATLVLPAPLSALFSAHVRRPPLQAVAHGRR